MHPDSPCSGKCDVECDADDRCITEDMWAELELDAFLKLDPRFVLRLQVHLKKLHTELMEAFQDLNVPPDVLRCKKEDLDYWTKLFNLLMQRSTIQHTKEDAFALADQNAQMSTDE